MCTNRGTLQLLLLTCCVFTIRAQQNAYGDELAGTQSGITCANVRCGGGTICTDVNGSPQCILVADEASLSCKTLRCQPQQRCEETHTGAQCVKVADVHNAPSHPEKICNLVDCKTGFVCVERKDGFADCVPSSPSTGSLKNNTSAGSLKCGINEEMNKCGNLCEPTCFNSAPFCIKICAQPACVCKNGYLRDTDRKTCVKSHQCPQVSPSKDAQSETSATKSDDVPTDYDPCIAATCMEGTICRSKQVFCIQAPCPPLAECVPNKCAEGEMYNECGNHCDPSCDNLNRACTLQCGPPACSCKEGHARKDGTCVPVERCAASNGRFMMRIRRK